MAKTVFIDLDSTTLTEDKQITPNTREAIRRAREAGHQIVVCTGRPFNYTEIFFDTLRCRYYIFCNGAGIYDALEKKLIHTTPMPTDAAFALCSHADKQNIRTILFGTDTVYCEDKTHILNNHVMLLTRDKHIDAPLNDFLQNHEVLETLFKNDSLHVVKEFKEFLMRDVLPKYPHASITYEARILCNPSAPRSKPAFSVAFTNKGEGVKKFCELTGTNLQDTIAIGDSKNDIAMFKVCATKVAMGNAIPELLQIADVITDDNNNDGVANFLKTLY